MCLGEHNSLCLMFSIFVGNFSGNTDVKFGCKKTCSPFLHPQLLANAEWFHFVRRSNTEKIEREKMAVLTNDQTV